MSDDNKELVEASAKLTLADNAPRPRLCHLKKWPHFQGYGFNLHAERSKLGQHIGKVDADSPAESAGLREGDRIIEVNYVNISNENHQQVVKRIRNGLPIDIDSPEDGKLNSDEVVLLVVDQEADDYYRGLNLIVKHDFDNVLRLKTTLQPPPINNGNSDVNNSVQDEKVESNSLNDKNSNVNNNNNNNCNNKTASDNTSVNSNKSNNINNDNLNRTNSSNSKTSTRSISSNDLDNNNNNNNNNSKLDNNNIKIDNNNNNKERTNSSYSQLKENNISNNNNNTKTSTMNSNRSDTNGTLSSNRSGSNITNGTTMKTDPYQYPIYIHTIATPIKKTPSKSKTNNKNKIDLFTSDKLTQSMAKEEAFKAFNQLIDSNKSFKNYNSYNGRFDHLMYFQSSTIKSTEIINGTSTINRRIKPPRPPPPATSRYSIMSTSKTNDDMFKNNNNNNNNNNLINFSNQNLQKTKSENKNKNKFYCDSSSDSSLSHYTQKSLFVSECFNNDDKLDRLLEMSAAEFRNYLKTKGRNDPRIVPVDMKQKYELFQNM